MEINQILTVITLITVIILLIINVLLFKLSSWSFYNLLITMYWWLSLFFQNFIFLTVFNLHRHDNWSLGCFGNDFIIFKIGWLISCWSAELPSLLVLIQFRTPQWFLMVCSGHVICCLATKMRTVDVAAPEVTSWRLDHLVQSSSQQNCVFHIHETTPTNSDQVPASDEDLLPPSSWTTEYSTIHVASSNCFPQKQTNLYYQKYKTALRTSPTSAALLAVQM